MYLYRIYTRGKGISYVREPSVNYMYERQVWIICTRGKCGSYVQEASVSPLDLKEHGPRRKKKKEGNITLYNNKAKNKECDCFTTKQ